MAGNTDYKFFGWVGKDKDCVNGKMVWEEYTPKTWTEDDVDIQITHCGICASDLHTLRSGWSASDYPVVVGHEIVGIVVKVGSNVKHLKLGDRVGVGAQSGSKCGLKCEWCTAGQEPYCDKGQVGTYNGRYPDADKSKSYGGYADYSRVPAHFAFKIPDALASENVAPMMCGGITVFSPLVHEGVGKGKKQTVGVLGVGGLGHYAVMFAAGLGADVIGISRSDSKRADILKMGAKDYIATGEGEQVAKALEPWRRKFDLIICTINEPTMPIAEYTKLLRPRSGKIVFVGLPEDNVSFNLDSVIGTNAYITGSSIGGSIDMKHMFDVATEKGVKTWVELRDMKDANKAIIDMAASKARYRYVLVNHKNLELLQKK